MHFATKSPGLTQRLLGASCGPGSGAPRSCSAFLEIFFFSPGPLGELWRSQVTAALRSLCRGVRGPRRRPGPRLRTFSRDVTPPLCHNHPYDSPSARTAALPSETLTPMPLPASPWQTQDFRIFLRSSCL